MNKKWMAPVVLGAVLAAAACDETTSDENVVARVGDYELTVDEAVELLVDEEQFAADARVVGRWPISGSTTHCWPRPWPRTARSPTSISSPSSCSRSARSWSFSCVTR